MSKTNIKFDKENILINNKPVYSDIKNSNKDSHGMLMNARFIQGIFDNKKDRSLFARFGIKEFDPDVNTDSLIKALPEWYQYGLRGITVGLQGGGPCFTIDNNMINNNPFGSDGKKLDLNYAYRLKKIIEASDELGMTVIVSFFYAGQINHLADGKSIRNAVITASNFIKELNKSNILIEIANEYNIKQFEIHPIIYYPEGILSLIKLAQKESGGIPVSTSGVGGSINEEIADCSNYILFHGNGQTRQNIYNLIKTIRCWNFEKPIIINEDSQSLGNMFTAIHNRVSWGYYNNLTKQEPPSNWGITKGEDQFFAYRMAEFIGINTLAIPYDKQYYFQGIDDNLVYKGKRWIRLASLHPKTINYVEYFRNNKLIYTSYDEPFTLNYINNWKFDGIKISKKHEDSNALVQVDSPKGAKNWGIGNIAPSYPGDGYFDSNGMPVLPRSLYLKQLEERLGYQALQNIAIQPQLNGNIFDILKQWAGNGDLSLYY